MVAVQLKKDVFNKQKVTRRPSVTGHSPERLNEKLKAFGLPSAGIIFSIIHNMFDKNFYCVSSRIENSGQLYGCFKIGPFSRYQSLTFANALRRTLLADRSRCTFSAVQIHDVEHEFSSLVGVRESVVDILLNLEKLIFKIKKPITKPQVALINFCGPGILRAQHISLPSNFQCVSPSQYIATLEVDGKLTLKLFFPPDWNKFQFFLQNFILEKKGDSNSRFFNFSSNTKKINRQKPPKNLFQHLSHSQSYPTPPGHRTFAEGDDLPSPKVRLKAKLSPSAKILHPVTSERERPPQKTLASTFSITQIFKNRLKIVHYLTNILYKSGYSSYLQRLNLAFSSDPAGTAEEPLKKTMTIQKLPWSKDPLFAEGEDYYKSCALGGGLSRPRSDGLKTVQYPKQQIQTNYKKNGALFLKNRKTRSLSTRTPIFAHKIQENFLFLNSSQCAIEKVNYTLQSLGHSVSNPSLLHFSLNPKGPSEQTFKGSSLQSWRRNWSQGETIQQNYLKKLKRINNFEEKSTEMRRSQRRHFFISTKKNAAFQLKCHLKLNTQSPIQRKLRALGHHGRIEDHQNGPVSTRQDSFGRKFNNLYRLSSAPPVEDGRALKGKAHNLNRMSPGYRYGNDDIPPAFEAKSEAASRLISQKVEFILFEVWTDGSILPQTAIFRAINELLFEIFPYSLQISKQVHPISNNKHTSAHHFSLATTEWARKVNNAPFLNRENSLKFIQNSLKRRKFDLSKKSFREKFLNLEIGNFYFGIETYLFLKKRKIHRIMDFLKFLNQKGTTKLLGSPQSKNLQTKRIKMTLNQFRIFLNSLIE